MLSTEQSKSVSCILCERASTCLKIRTGKGAVVSGNILVDAEFCEDWLPVLSQRGRTQRQMAWDLAGVHSISALEQLITPIKEESVHEEEMLGRPNFEDMLYEGIGKAERLEQLMFQTDLSGTKVVTDLNGEKLARPTYEVRQFACDPESYIKLPHSMAVRWTTKAISIHIAKKEIELGYVSKGGKKTKSSGKTPVEKTPAKLAKEDKKMAGKKIKITRGGGSLKLKKVGGAAPKSTAKAALPPKKSKAADIHAEAPTGLPEPQMGNDFAEVVAALVVEKMSSSVLEDLQLQVGATVTKAINDKMNEVTAEIEAVRSDAIKAVTVLHDILAQTSGSMTYTDEDGNEVNIPELLEDPNLIMAYLAGDEGE